MDPTTLVCPHWACPARGQAGEGNSRLHSRQDKRWRGTACHKTFSATTGTALYRLRTSAETVPLGVTRMAHGCPRPARGVAWGCDERTGAAWGARAGRQGQAVQAQLGEGPRARGQVPAAAIRVKTPGGIVGRALAMRVKTRLGLAGVVRAPRERPRMRRLLERGRRGAAPAPLGLGTDG
jgi:transposase-like protein